MHPMGFPCQYLLQWSRHMEWQDVISVTLEMCARARHMYISLRPAHESSILHLPSFLFFLFPDSTITPVKPSQLFVMPAYNSGSTRQLRSRNRQLASDETHRLPTASIGMASKSRDIIMSERIITDGPSPATDVDAAMMDEMAASSTREDTAQPQPVSWTIPHPQATSHHRTRMLQPVPSERPFPVASDPPLPLTAQQAN